MDDDGPQFGPGYANDGLARIDPLPTLQAAPRPSSTQGIVGSAFSWIFGAPRSTSVSPWTTYSPLAPLVPATSSRGPSLTAAPSSSRHRLPPRPTLTTSIPARPTTTMVPDRDDDEPSVSLIEPIISSTSAPEPTALSTFDTLISSSASEESSESQTTEHSLTVLEPLQSTRTRLTKTITSTSTLGSTTSATLVPIGRGGASAESEGIDNPASFNKTSGATIGGIAGGISAAILLALLAFLFWKLRRRRERSLDKRSSFDPYANGIDASQGGLLVQAVPFKTDDQLSGKETLYSDDQSTTRYQQSTRTSADNPRTTGGNQTPASSTAQSTPFTTAQSSPYTGSNATGAPIPLSAPAPAPIPMRMTHPDPVYGGGGGPYSAMPPRRSLEDPPRNPYPPFVPDPSLSGYVPRPLRPHHNPRPYPQLYNRRRPPPPPSMRRARGPPMHRMYDNGYPPRHDPILDEGIPGVGAMEPPGAGFAGPYPSSSGVMRSSSMQAYYQSRGADLARMERNRRVQRSATTGGMHRGPYGPYGPSPYGNYRPRPEGPYQGVPRPSGRQQGPPMHSQYPMPSQQQSQGYYEDYSHQKPGPIQLNADAAAAAAAHQDLPPQVDLVQRATNNNHGGDQSRLGAEHAARNF